MPEPRSKEHFADLCHQKSAAEVGVWVFLSSETLLFAGLFGLYTTYRTANPEAFRIGMEHMAHVLGATNTFVLLTSSFSAALSLASLHAGRTRLAASLVALTVAFGLVFLVIKGVEYADHIHNGMYPGAIGELVWARPVRGVGVFVALYYLMTGLHALHVTAGIAVLTWLGSRIVKGTVTRRFAHPLELGVLYWHLVDMVWVFLWPMFYFARGAAG
jgi:cytochrome c oxidase subunit 3